MHGTSIHSFNLYLLLAYFHTLKMNHKFPKFPPKF